MNTEVRLAGGAISKYPCTVSWKTGISGGNDGRIKAVALVSVESDRNG